MLKKSLLLLLLLSFTLPILGQSDYIYLQEFKKGVKKIELKIKKAKTEDALKKISEDIVGFYTYHKMRQNFLDKALYPDNFDSIIEKLKRKVFDKEKEIKLYTKTAKLKNQVSKLERSINALSSGYYKSVKTIDSLNNALIIKSEREKLLKRQIADMQKNLNDRNNLITGLLDTLLLVKNRTATEPELEGTSNYIKINGDNLIGQMITLLNDNISYLTIQKEISPHEYDEIIKEQKLFDESFNKIPDAVWKQLLGENADITNFKKNVNQLSARWKKQIDKSLTARLYEIFAEHKVKLDSAETFDDLLQSLFDYAEKKSIEAGSHYERLHNYKVFADTLWNREFLKNWAPILEQNGFISADDITSMQNLNSDWLERANKKTPLLLYLIISFILGTILIYIIAAAKRNKYKHLGIAKKKKREYEEKKKNRGN